MTTTRAPKELLAFQLLDYNLYCLSLYTTLTLKLVKAAVCWKLVNPPSPRINKVLSSVMTL